MKATIDIPDDLYRRVKAKSDLEGRPIRSVALELFQRWLEGDIPPRNRAAAGPPEDLDGPIDTTSRSAEQWLDDWFRLADQASRHAPPGPTATEILEADRNRQERS